MDKSDHPSSSGERAALSGYLHQYHFAAEIIRAKLAERSLGWVEFMGDEAGQLDDFQWGNDTEHHAYQVKWPESNPRMTFNNLVIQKEKVNRDGGSFEKDPLLKQIATSWKKIKEKQSDVRLHVYLITNRTLSRRKDDSMKKVDSKDSLNLRGFYNKVLEPYQKALRNNEDTPDLGIWKNSWEQFKNGTGLGDDDFKEFLIDFNLETEQSHNYFVKKTFGPSEQIEIYEEVKYIRDKIFALAGQNKDTKMNLNKLIQLLNWENKFALYSPHHSWQLEKSYTPSRSTEEKLDGVLGDVKSGYIALTGNPGQGKSSFLTYYFKKARRTSIFYYANIPETQKSTTLVNSNRGESEVFLLGVVKAILKNFRIDQLPREGIYALKEQLKALLGEIAPKKNDKKQSNSVYIIIDGLDHVVDDYHPQRSMLNDLLDPSEIPSGVFFVFGTRRTSLKGLGRKIKKQLSETSRTIRLEPLTQAECRSVVEKIDDDNDDDEGGGKESIKLIDESEEIWVKSDGQPLVMSILIKQLKGCNSKEEVQKVLEVFEPIDDVEELYEKVFFQIEEQDAEIKKTLQKMTLLRRPLDENLLSQNEKLEDQIEKVMKIFGQFFERKNGRYLFFHESLRQFLEKNLQETVGKSPKKLKKHHQKIAKWCKSSDNKEWQWEELYHRLKAENYERAKELCSPEVFREQFFSFRSRQRIVADVVMVLESGIFPLHSAEMLSLAFLLIELEQRNLNLPESMIIDVLIQSGQSKKALEYMFQEQNVLLDSSEALKVAYRLKDTEPEQGKALFEYLKPSDLLKNQQINPFQVESFYSEWAKAAACYMSPKQLLKAARRYYSEQENYKIVDEKNQQRAKQNTILKNAIDEYLDQEKWELAEVLIQGFSTEDDHRVKLRCLYVLFDKAKLKFKEKAKSAARRYCELWEGLDDESDIKKGIYYQLYGIDAYFLLGKHDEAKSLGDQLPNPLFIKQEVQDYSLFLDAYFLWVSIKTQLESIDYNTEEIIFEKDIHQKTPYLDLAKSTIEAVHNLGVQHLKNPITKEQYRKVVDDYFREYEKIPTNELSSYERYRVQGYIKGLMQRTALFFGQEVLDDYTKNNIHKYIEDPQNHNELRYFCIKMLSYGADQDIIKEVYSTLKQQGEQETKPEEWIQFLQNQLTLASKLGMQGEVQQLLEQIKKESFILDRRGSGHLFAVLHQIGEVAKTHPEEAKILCVQFVDLILKKNIPVSINYKEQLLRMVIESAIRVSAQFGKKIMDYTSQTIHQKQPMEFQSSPGLLNIFLFATLRAAIKKQEVSGTVRRRIVADFESRVYQRADFTNVNAALYDASLSDVKEMVDSIRSNTRIDHRRNYISMIRYIAAQKFSEEELATISWGSSDSFGYHHQDIRDSSILVYPIKPEEKTRQQLEEDISIAENRALAVLEFMKSEEKILENNPDYLAFDWASFLKNLSLDEEEKRQIKEQFPNAFDESDDSKNTEKLWIQVYGEKKYLDQIKSKCKTIAQVLELRRQVKTDTKDYMGTKIFDWLAVLAPLFEEASLEELKAVQKAFLAPEYTYILVELFKESIRRNEQEFSEELLYTIVNRSLKDSKNGMDYQIIHALQLYKKKNPQKANEYLQTLFFQQLKQGNAIVFSYLNDFYSFYNDDPSTPLPYTPVKQYLQQLYEANISTPSQKIDDVSTKAEIADVIDLMISLYIESIMLRKELSEEAVGILITILKESPERGALVAALIEKNFPEDTEVVNQIVMIALASESQPLSEFLSMRLEEHPYKKIMEQIKEAKGNITHAVIDVQIESEDRVLDPYFLDKKPVPKPDDYQVMLLAREELRENWLKIHDNRKNIIAEKMGANIILAEHYRTNAMNTNFSERNRSTREEICSSQIVSENMQVTSDSMKAMFVNANMNYSEYQEMTHTEGKTIVYSGTPRYVSECTEWIAISPVLARDMGWKLSNKGLFRWEDKDGKTMVESIWWRDQKIMTASYNPLVSAEGWCVLVSPEAYIQLNKHCNFKQKTAWVTKRLKDKEHIGEESKKEIERRFDFPVPQ